MASILTTLKDKYIAMRGFHTDRHLLIIESDDWGSIRMPSYDTFCKLRRRGDHPEKDGFLSNDSLENEKDLTALFEVLSSVHDKNGNPVVITANFVMANPDFEKIDYHANKYVFEPFYETYKRYDASEKVLDTIKRGMQDRVFYPQLHCREHLNVNRWMKALRDGKPDATLAFENEMIGVFASFSDSNRFGYMDAFNTDQTSNDELREILNDAMTIFSETFGYRSKTFVASCFVWADEFESVLSEQGIAGIQSAPWQNCAVGEKGNYRLKRKIHYTGQRNRNRQIYTVRNCGYEPAYFQNPEECVEECFQAVSRSFRDRKPAIINSHRFNYISRLNPRNATNNLLGLKLLLSKIKKEYPDVEFITTSDLIDIIQLEGK